MGNGQRRNQGKEQQTDGRKNAVHTTQQAPGRKPARDLVTPSDDENLQLSKEDRSKGGNGHDHPDRRDMRDVEIKRKE